MIFIIWFHLTTESPTRVLFKKIIILGWDIISLIVWMIEFIVVLLVRKKRECVIFLPLFTYTIVGKHWTKDDPINSVRFYYLLDCLYPLLWVPINGIKIVLSLSSLFNLYNPLLLSFIFCVCLSVHLVYKISSFSCLNVTVLNMFLNFLQYVGAFIHHLDVIAVLLWRQIVSRITVRMKGDVRSIAFRRSTIMVNINFLIRFSRTYFFCLTCWW